MSPPCRNQFVILGSLTGECNSSIADQKALSEPIPLRSRLDSFFFLTIFSPASPLSCEFVYYVWHGQLPPDYRHLRFHARL